VKKKIEKMKAVVRVTQSPMNPVRWNLTLSCGHEVWVNGVSKPRFKSFECPACKTKG
jgi:hypothetical protein